MSKIVVFNGSPHANRTTAAVLNAIADGAASKGAEIVHYDLNAKYIRGCQDCGSCRREGKEDAEMVCVEDDYLKPMYKDVLEATGIVLGTPIYGGNITAQTLTFLQRLRPFRDPERRSLIPGKNFVTVITQGNPDKDQYVPRIAELQRVFVSYGWEQVADVVWGGAGLVDGALPEDMQKEAFTAGEKLV
ncbi:MAG: flavodoxin family protein [Oscillospiraceae bacterium]|nr:flavodoxin family protein [Oscillospiraceae bacterium]